MALLFLRDKGIKRTMAKGKYHFVQHEREREAVVEGYESKRPESL